jgi:hypothetical protein
MPSGMWRKHAFGRTESGVERYMTLMVVGRTGMFEAKLFGTETEQQRMECKTIREGCKEMDDTFKELFPDHVCGAECLITWHRWPEELSSSETLLQ